MPIRSLPGLPVAVLDALPNPVLVKDAETRYVWVNQAFERLFHVRREDLEGRLDVEVFQDRQAAQCNGGDLRVLETGEVDEATETVVDPEMGERETITRKSRIELDGVRFLIGVMHDVTDMVEQNRELTRVGTLLEAQAVELQRLASTDPLTGCLNRRALFRTMSELLESDGDLGIISFDLDHFKDVNDTVGHEAGDHVLTEVIDRVRREVRTTDLVARIGGEEFVVMLPEHDRAGTERVAERIRAAIAGDPVDLVDGTWSVTASVGATHRRAGDDETVEELLRDVDRLLYDAKGAGRNTVSVG